MKKKLHIEYEDPCKFGKNYEVTGPGVPNAMAFSFCTSHSKFFMKKKTQNDNFSIDKI